MLSSPLTGPACLNPALYAESDERADYRRRAARLRAVQTEMQEMEDERAFEHNQEKKIRATEREQKIVDHLAQVKHDYMKNEKMLQLVRENEPELRELDRKIKAAYAKKHRQGQIAERVEREEEDKEENRRYFEFLKEEAVKADEEDKRKIEERMGEIKNVHAILEEQKRVREEQCKIAEEQERQHKKEVDAVVAKVQEQDYLNSLKKAHQQQTEKKEHVDFIAKKAALEQMEKDRLAAEDRAVKVYHEEQEKRLESDKKLKLEKELLKSRILTEQTRIIIEERRKKEALEELINDYYEEERDQRLDMEEKKKRQKKEESKEALLSFYRQQMVEKQLKKEADALEERRFRAEMTAKLEQEMHVEQMSREKATRIKIEYMRHVQELIEDKRRRASDEIKVEEILNAQQKAKEDDWKRYVAEERRRMLSEHAEVLADAAPPGLRQEDLDIIHEVLRRKIEQERSEGGGVGDGVKM